ncbi:MAG TPA: hypothetical protein VNJ54_11205 [Plantibacter sp.]|uniref:hypothetical protein n=1 Tax=unclassified Plantibacter TaxID=2624265 RepID=UPI002BADB1E7|nr:hypothetical protein [Plantibacter sp.]
MTPRSLPLPGCAQRGLSLQRLAAAVPLVLALLLAIVLGGAVPASALTATGTAYGHRSPLDGRWLGSWAFDDGSVGFCINLDLPIPPGHPYEHVDGASLGWFTPEDAARLAYLSRKWGASTDADQAAAGQLATWMITGLNGQTPERIAARAGAAADRVLALARQMLAEADGPGGASRGASASVHIVRGEDGFDIVRTELAVDTIASGQTTLPPSVHDATVTLEGATFEDGETVKTIGNGEGHRILPDSDSAVVSFSAAAVFGELPYGAGLTIATSPAHVQSVLVARPITVAAEAVADRTRPTPLPFQPVVVTTTSLATAEPGAEVVDHLAVGIATDAGLATEWGVVGPDGGPYTPIPVTVRSQLLGPFAEAPVEAPEVPLGAPVVCEVVTTVDTGPGEYTTPSCILPEAGYFVWVERIEPGDTPPEAGGSMIRPWRSAFGVASEVTLVDAPPVPEVSEERLAETGTDDRALSTSALIAGLSLAVGAAVLVQSRVTPPRAAGRAGRGRRRATALPGSR